MFLRSAFLRSDSSDGLMVSWKLGPAAVGGGADISTLAVPRQQSNIRMTWVATGTSCKETGQRVKDYLVS